MVDNCAAVCMTSRRFGEVVRVADHLTIGLDEVEPVANGWHCGWLEDNAIMGGKDPPGQHFEMDRWRCIAAEVGQTPPGRQHRKASATPIVHHRSVPGVD
jgi:hypothetical protein